MTVLEHMRDEFMQRMAKMLNAPSYNQTEFNTAKYRAEKCQELLQDISPEEYDKNKLKYKAMMKFT